MTSGFGERLSDLLADRATVGLSAEESAELNRLAARFSEHDDDAFDLAAAATHLALGVEQSQLPPALRRRVVADADTFFGSRTARRSSLGYWSGWLAAAASLLLAFFIWARDPAAVEAGAAERRARLLALASDAVTLAWSPTADPTAGAAEGDVVWSDARQEGYMRFRGLQANEAGSFQYQLWIFDAERSADYPVDGGVFDVPTGVEEWVVPIDPRVPVSHATLFAVTVERPGGVVVSSRERIALIAQPAQG